MWHHSLGKTREWVLLLTPGFLRNQVKKTNVRTKTAVNKNCEGCKGRRMFTLSSLKRGRGYQTEGYISRFRKKKDHPLKGKLPNDYRPIALAGKTSRTRETKDRDDSHRIKERRRGKANLEKEEEKIPASRRKRWGREETMLLTERKGKEETKVFPAEVGAGERLKCQNFS